MGGDDISVDDLTGHFPEVCSYVILALVARTFFTSAY